MDRLPSHISKMVVSTVCGGGLRTLRRGGPGAEAVVVLSAEFMTWEPVKPTGRSCKPQPATSSLFEWVLDNEREREAAEFVADSAMASLPIQSQLA